MGCPQTYLQKYGWRPRVVRSHSCKTNPWKISRRSIGYHWIFVFPSKVDYEWVQGIACWETQIILYIYIHILNHINRMLHSHHSSLIGHPVGRRTVDSWHLGGFVHVKARFSSGPVTGSEGNLSTLQPSAH